MHSDFYCLSSAKRHLRTLKNGQETAPLIQSALYSQLLINDIKHQHPHSLMEEFIPLLSAGF